MDELNQTQSAPENPIQPMGQPVEHKKSNVGVIILIVAALLLVGGGAYAVYYFGLFNTEKQASVVSGDVREDMKENIGNSIVEEEMGEEAGLRENDIIVEVIEDRELDTDGDLLTDYLELLNGSDPLIPDTDGDGLTDYTEVYNGTDTTNPDTDGDGLSDYLELLNATDPFNPDTDGDGFNDGVEVENGYDPLK